MHDPEASCVTGVISNLVAGAGMCDMLSPLLGGPHSLTSETAAQTYSSSSAYCMNPRSLWQSPLPLKQASPSWKPAELVIQMLVCAEKKAAGRIWTICSLINHGPVLAFLLVWEEKIKLTVSLLICSCDSYITITNKEMLVGFPAGNLFSTGQIQMDGWHRPGAIVMCRGGSPASAPHWDQLPH